MCAHGLTEGDVASRRRLGAERPRHPGALKGLTSQKCQWQMDYFTRCCYIEQAPREAWADVGVRPHPSERLRRVSWPGLLGVWSATTVDAIDRARHFSATLEQVRPLEKGSSFSSPRPRRRCHLLACRPKDGNEFGRLVTNSGRLRPHCVLQCVDESHGLHDAPFLSSARRGCWRRGSNGALEPASAVGRLHLQDPSQCPAQRRCRLGAGARAVRLGRTVTPTPRRRTAHWPIGREDGWSSSWHVSMGRR